MMIFGVLMSPGFYRLVYASVSTVREEVYVDAAPGAGLFWFPAGPDCVAARRVDV